MACIALRIANLCPGSQASLQNLHAAQRPDLPQHLQNGYSFTLAVAQPQRYVAEALASFASLGGHDDDAASAASLVSTRQRTLRERLLVR